MKNYTIVVKITETRIEKMHTDAIKEVRNAADSAVQYRIISCKIFDNEEDEPIFFSVRGRVIIPLQL